jgi:amino acid adenylation domain-containing protein
VPVTAACADALAALQDDVMFSRVQAAARSLALRYSAGEEVCVAAVADDHMLDAARDGLLVRVQRAADHRRMALVVDAAASAAADRLLARFGRNLAALLDDSAARPEVPLERLDYLDPAERELLHTTWNAVEITCRQVTVAQLFSEQARRTPDAVAVRCRDRSVTYAELDRQVDALTAALCAAGAEPDVPVAILVDRSIEMVVAVLAVHRAGAATMPLDPTHPPERLASVLDIAECGILLSSRVHTAVLGVLRRLMVTVVIEDTLARPPVPYQAPLVALDHLVYVVFTSGSTGVPKGIAMPHRSLSHLVQWQIEHFHSARDAAAVLHASFIFDVFYQELYGTLAAGGCLVVVPDGTRADFVRLCELVNEHGVRRVSVPTVALRYLANAIAEGAPLPACLEELVVAGEQLQVSDAVRAMFARLPAAVLVNQYGPAETHAVTEAAFRGPSSSWPTVPGIGRPLPNCPMYILDDNLDAVPIGAVGELCLAGACVSRGYINRPGLSAERFVPAPWTGSRMYRTGDLARFEPDGSIQFLGRRDSQHKVRGFRIELEEIEVALGRHPDVRDTAVTVHASSSGDGEKILVAYVVTGATPPPDAAELQQFLAETLPEYMVPPVIEIIAAMPKTSSGKIDRRSLPAPAHKRAAP